MGTDLKVGRALRPDEPAPFPLDALQVALVEVVRGQARQPLTLRSFALLLLLHKGQPIHVRRLSRELGVHYSTISRVLEGLEGAGLVLRRYPDADHRLTEAEIAPGGTLYLNELARLLRGAQPGAS